jgi:LPXTG-motif cell wall-anchored protein
MLSWGNALGDFGGGLLKGMPPVGEVPLPATGAGGSATMAAIAGSLLLVGCAMSVSARVRRR